MSMSHAICVLAGMALGAILMLFIVAVAEQKPK